MLVRRARERAGLLQSDLAEQAGTSAPTVSAYEHGRRQPRADVLWRLLEAAGLRVVLADAGTLSSRYVDLLCAAIADRIRADPDLMEAARAELDDMPQTTNTHAWEKLLAAGVPAVIAVLTSPDPDARGLKADNPFARLGIIDEDTRLSLLKEASGRGG